MQAISLWGSESIVNYLITSQENISDFSCVPFILYYIWSAPDLITRLVCRPFGVFQSSSRHPWPFQFHSREKLSTNAERGVRAIKSAPLANISRHGNTKSVSYVYTKQRKPDTETWSKMRYFLASLDTHSFVVPPFVRSILSLSTRASIFDLDQRQRRAGGVGNGNLNDQVSHVLSMLLV